MYNNLTTSNSGTFNILSNPNIITGTSITGLTGSTTGVLSNTTGYSHTANKYKLWGSEVESFSTNGDNTTIIISLLNMLGTTFWDQMVMNNIKNEMNYLLFDGIEELYKKQKRKEKLDILLKDNEDF